MKNGLLSILLILAFWHTGLCQPFSIGIGKADSAYFPQQILRVGNKLFMLDIMANSDFSHYNLVATKLDTTGKVMAVKGFDVGNLEFSDRRLFRIKNNIYFVGRVNVINDALFLKLDTNLAVLKSIRFSGIGINRLAFSDTATRIFATSDYNNIIALDTDLDIKSSVNYRDTLGRKVEFKEITSLGGHVYVNFNSHSMVFDAYKMGVVTFSYGLIEERSRIFPTESGSYPGGGDRNDFSLSFLDSVRVISQISFNQSSNYFERSIYNFSTDSLFPFKLSLLPNPAYDTFPIDQSQESTEISLNRRDASGTFYYWHNRKYDTEVFRKQIFIGRLNPITGKVSNYRARLGNPRPANIGNPSDGKYSLQATKYLTANMLGIGFYNQLDLDDTTNCIAFPDTFAHIEWGPKFKMLPYRLVASDTNISVENYPLTEFSVKLCEFDFCNPPSYSGLGPDIQTCADSVMLQGKVVYAGQKLQWSTSDTTLQVKVPVGAGNTYSIKISGICGTFDDTIVVQPKTTVSVDFPQSQDSVKTCKPILLQPTAQQWIAPRWFTPKGVILNQQQLFADTSGFYIIQNDEGDCARRDSIYIDLQPVSRPDLQLPDTILTCKDVLLSPMANQWGNPSWQTPGGVFGSISITANLTGKYVVQNEILGCRAKDSVYIIRKVPSVIFFFNQPDTVFTCQSVLLSPVAQSLISPVWQTPNGTFTNVNSFRVTSSGAYKVTNDIGNCANSDSVYIVYRDTADIDFLLRSGGANLTNFDMVLKENQFPFVVDAVTQTQALRYRWFLNGQIQNGNGFTQGFTLPNSGVYTIDLLTQSVDSCIGKARKVLTIQELILPAPVIPNLVTINGDQQNEHFEIEQIPFYPDNELIIYNRWGKEIFRSRPYQNNWPPSDLSPGTYFYRLHAGEVTYQGWVEVVRN